MDGNGIIIITETGLAGRGFTSAQNNIIGDIVGAYKSLVANECLKIYNIKNQTMGKLWQRNYYEHIIRDEKSYLEIAQYILENPTKWALDSLFSGGTP